MANGIDCWHLILRGARHGPVGTQTLRDLVAARELASDDVVWHPGLAGWTRVDAVPELATLLADGRTSDRPRRRAVLAAAVAGWGLLALLWLQEVWFDRL